jgi:hypothetical protein
MRERRTIRWTCCALAAAATVVAAEAGSVIHVDATAPEGGDGTSWVTAFNDLQDALAAAVPNDEIWVAAGVYTPAGPNGDREASFALVDAVPLFGGFAGWEENLNERDWILNETILSGDLNGDDGPDFENNDENSFHVVTTIDLPSLGWLDGFTVTAGNANVGWYPDYTIHGGGVFSHESQLWIRHCTVRCNSAGRAGGAVYVDGGSLATEQCSFQHNRTTEDTQYGGGGAVYCAEANLTMTSCELRDNNGPSHGGALGVYDGGTVTLAGCTFADNVADVAGACTIRETAPIICIAGCHFVDNSAFAGGALFIGMYSGAVDLNDCAFIENEAEILGGALVVGNEYLSAIDCVFVGNCASYMAGAVEDAADESIFVNCAFSRNVADLGGGACCAYEKQYVNCTFSHNFGSGLTTEDEINPVITNCIFWGNTPEQIAEDPAHPGGDPIVTYSDIQGGWNGGGNIHADPLFVQPMADDLRLGFGSPCVNAGDNDAVPPYIETDILGNDRFIDGIVDMGAYEGEYEMLPPAAVEYDLDQGEGSILLPHGGEFNPVSASAAIVANTSGPDNGTVMITEYDVNLHPEGEGFSMLGMNLQAETSLADGELRIQAYIPFDATDLDGADPALLDVTYFDETAGTWALGVSHNTGHSPGHDGPIGDRIVIVDGGNWGLTADAGDWGVFWDPAEQKGFVWANVDYQGDFAFGVPLCPPDCAQPPDGFVGDDDLSALLAAWSDGLGPFDVNNDGSVNVVDLLTILASWGPCP